MTSKQGPHVVAAVFCERDLVEVDGVHSLIRLVDVHTQEVRSRAGATEEEIQMALKGTPFPTGLTFFALFWAERSETKPVSIEFVYDDGYRLPAFNSDLEFIEGKGTNLRIFLEAPFPRVGRLWAEVSIGGELRTRSPLMLQRKLIEGTS